MMSAPQPPHPNLLADSKTSSCAAFVLVGGGGVATEFDRADKRNNTQMNPLNQCLVHLVGESPENSQYTMFFVHNVGQMDAIMCAGVVLGLTIAFPAPLSPTPVIFRLFKCMLVFGAFPDFRPHTSDFPAFWVHSLVFGPHNCLSRAFEPSTGAFLVFRGAFAGFWASELPLGLLSPIPVIFWLFRGMQASFVVSGSRTTSAPPRQCPRSPPIPDYPRLYPRLPSPIVPTNPLKPKYLKLSAPRAFHQDVL